MPHRRAALALSLVLLHVGLLAAAPADDALAVVKRTLDQALDIARANTTRDENLAALRTLGHDFLDTQKMGRRAIGDVLAAQPAEQQTEYLELFDAVMVRAYLSKLLLFRSPRFGYGDPRPVGDGVIVPTRIATTKDEYQVEYPMQQRDGRWLAIDVVVEGISLTDGYRTQFASLLRDRSFTELLDLMRAKVRPRGEAAP